MIVRVNSFRSHPKRSALKYFFSSERPDKLVARSLLLREGSTYYNDSVRLWFYAPKTMKDNRWNRRLLIRDLRSMNSEKRALFLSRYPLSPNSEIMDLIREELFEKRSYSFLEVITRAGTPESRRLFNSWLDSLKTNPSDKKAFFETLPYVTETPRQMMPLVRAFWPFLFNDEKCTSFDIIADGLDPDSAGAEEILRLLDESLRQGFVESHGSPVVLLGKFLGRRDTRAAATSILEREAVTIAAGDLDSAFEALPSKPREEVALILFNALKYNNVAAIDAFSQIASADVVLAETIAEPLIESLDDSTLKKGLIVILVRNNSRLGQQHIDQAFMGTAQRITLFKFSSQYIYGSQAADRYEKITHHEYRWHGKFWPPDALGRKQFLLEMREWPSFIKQFPWFPGTDDAYYRFAYCQYITGHTEGAVDTVLKYFSDDHPDTDAEPYLQFTLRTIVRKRNYPPRFEDFLHHAYSILASPPGIAVLDPKPSVREALAATDWFLAKPIERKSLGVSEEELNLLRDIYLSIESTPQPDRFQRVNALLEKEETPRILYARFFDDNIISLDGTLPEDFSAISMRDAAARMTTLFRESKDNQDTKLCKAILNWMRLHRKWDHDARFTLNEWVAMQPAFDTFGQAVYEGDCQQQGR